MKTKMSVKKSVLSMLSVLLSVLLLISLSACKKEITSDESADIWADAIYTEDTAWIGDGEYDFKIKVIVGDNSVTFDVNTSKETVGDALLESGIISGDMGPYGLYVKTVNGIYADYEANGAYWAFYKNGELANTGVDGEKIDSGADYEMVYTKG